MTAARFCWLRWLALFTVVLSAFLPGALLHAAPGSSQTESAETHVTAPSIPESSTMKIRLTFNGQSITATLDDSPTTRDFITLLPLTLTFEDYAKTEKIAYLPRTLSEAGAPAGMDPSIGDITYYSPWGNLALFYRDFGYAQGLIKLGSLDEDTEASNVTGSVTVSLQP